MLKKLSVFALAILFCLGMATQAFALYGLEKYWFAVYDEQSNIIDSGTSSIDILVYDAGTTNKATIYSDDVATSKSQSSAWHPESSGLVEFYSAASTVDVTVANDSYTVQKSGLTKLEHKVILINDTTLNGLDDVTVGATTASTGAFTTLAMGTSGTPLTSSTEEKKFLSCYYTATGKNIFGWYLSISQTYATSGAPRGLTIRTSLDHTTGHAVQGANSVDARVTLGADNTGISGEMHAMESQLKVDADTRSVNGTYAAHKFTNYFKTGNTMPATTYFLRFVDQNGTNVATPFMFDFSGITAGASNCIEADTDAVGTPSGYIRVKDPAGATGYIVIYGDHS